jgi:hypothetical protein
MSVEPKSLFDEEVGGMSTEGDEDLQALVMKGNEPSTLKSASLEQLKAELAKKEKPADEEEFAPAQRPVPLMGSN